MILNNLSRLAVYMSTFSRSLTTVLRKRDRNTVCDVWGVCPAPHCIEEGPSEKKMENNLGYRTGIVDSRIFF